MTIQSLQPNKSMIFNFFTQINERIIRTGVKNPNSFIHSLLHACDSQYLTLNDSEKNQKIDLYIRDIFSCKTNLTSLPMRFENIHKSLMKDEKLHFYESKDIPLLKIILSGVVPLSYIIEVCNNEKNNTVELLIEKFDNNQTIKRLPQKKLTIIREIVLTFFKNVCDMHASDNTIKNDEIKIDKNTICKLSNYFNVNIFVLDSKTCKPVSLYSNLPMKKKYSVVLVELYDSPNKYEIIGELSSENKVTRKFNCNSDVVKSIRNFYRNLEDSESEDDSETSEDDSENSENEDNDNEDNDNDSDNDSEDNDNEDNDSDNDSEDNEDNDSEYNDSEDL